MSHPAINPTEIAMPPEPGGLLRALKPMASVAGPLIGLALVLLIFGLWNPADFLSVHALRNVSRSSYTIAIAAVGATFVVISGGIDLSVGSTMALSCVACAMALRGQQLPPADMTQTIAVAAAGGLLTALAVAGKRLSSGAALLSAASRALLWAAACGAVLGLGWHLAAGHTVPPLNPWLAVLVGIAAGATVGAVNATLVTVVSLPPFVATLATLGAVRGLAEYMTNGVPVEAGTGPSVELARAGFASLRHLHYGTVLGLPPNAWIAIGIVLAGIPLLHMTVLGRYTFAIGSNPRTARLCGVRVERWKAVCYILAGSTAGLAGALATAKYGAGPPTEFTGVELTVIAAVVLGGTSLFGGEGMMLGTALGVLMLGFLQSGCNIALISSFMQRIFIGGTIVLAAALDRFRHMRQ